MKQVIPFYKEIVFKNTIANLTSISLEHKENVLDGEVSGEFIIFGDYKIHNDTTEKEEFKYKLPFTALIPDDVDPTTVVVDIANFKYEQIDNDVLRIDIDFSIEGDSIPLVEEPLVQRVEDLEILDENIDNEIDEILNISNDEEITENEDLVFNRSDDEKTIDDKEICEDIDVNEEESQGEEIELIQERDRETMNDIMLPNENVVIEEKETSIKEEVKEEVTKETKEEYVTYHVHVVSNTDSVESIIKLYNTNMDILNEYNDIKELKVGDKVIIPEYLDE